LSEQADILFHTPYGDFELRRWPLLRRELLRAWDAADAYLLDTLAEGCGIESTGRILLCNDAFGALSLALNAAQVTNWSDSWIAHQACLNNLEQNGIDAGQVGLLPATEIPSGPIDVVLIKVPKTLALLEYQLQVLRPLLADNALVLVAGMVKHLPKSLWSLLESYIGPTQTSLARQKARVIRVNPDFAIEPPKANQAISWDLDPYGLTLVNQVNVFSREKLDIGTRLLLEHFPETSGKCDIVDLGCGNGVLGLVAAQANLKASLTFIDESYMAIESARENAAQLGARSAMLNFLNADGLQGYPENSADLVLCNPPFHQQHTVSAGPALAMLRESARVLRQGGELWLVGNRHLGYHKLLGRWFGSVEAVGSNRKFVVLRAIAA
jgi:16S rRNA (guanine1207-N2)-methyltransferase